MPHERVILGHKDANVETLYNIYGLDMPRTTGPKNPAQNPREKGIPPHHQVCEMTYPEQIRLVLGIGACRPVITWCLLLLRVAPAPRSPAGGLRLGHLGCIVNP